MGREILVFNAPSGSGGGITNDAPANTVPVTTDGSGNLGASPATYDGARYNDSVEVEGPMNAQSAFWNVSIVNTVESGTFTIIVTVDQDAPVETGAIDFDATADEVRDAIRTALTAGDACNGSNGPLPSAVTLQFGGSTTDQKPIVLELGSNNLVGDFPTPQFSESQPGTTGVTGYRLGQVVYDSDENVLFWNRGDESNPEWLPVGTIYNEYPNSLALLNNLSANGLIIPRLSQGGSGVATDEYNVFGQDGTSGAAVIAGATDPSAGGGFSPNYIRGTLYLRNPNDDDATPGSMWLKRISNDQAAWSRVVTYSGSTPTNGELLIGKTSTGTFDKATAGAMNMALPTSDPAIAGALWSNLGAVQVSNG